jgi:hypothetical protein
MNYSGIDMYMLGDFREKYLKGDELVCARANSSAPFARQVDLWWVACMAAVRRNSPIRIPPNSSNLVKFEDAGRILQPWQHHVLECVAIQSIEATEEVPVQRDVIKIAHKFAYSGLRIVAEEVLEKPGDYAANLADWLGSVLGKPVA